MSDTTLTLQDFIRLLSAQVSCDETIASDFVRELSSAIAHGLATDGFVNIAGLGSFRVINDVEGTPTVEFAPAPSLAAAVNEPFSMFEPVELADSVTDEEVAAPAVSTPPPVPPKYKMVPEVKAEAPEESPAAPPAEPIVEPVATAEPIVEPVATVEPTVEPVATAEPAVEPVAKPVVEPVAPVLPPVEPVIEHGIQEEPRVEQPEPAPRLQETTPPKVTIVREPMPEVTRRETPLPVLLEPESHVTVKRVGHTTLTLLLAAAAALLLGICIGAVIGYNFHRSLSVEAVPSDEPLVQDTFSEDESSAEPIDSVTEPVAADTTETDADIAEPAIVTDTVGPGNYLSIMARRHYGNSKFWVYIYLENKDKIRNPDNLENGMVLIIPPAEKYDIDSSDKESLARAQREATRIANEQ